MGAHGIPDDSMGTHGNSDGPTVTCGNLDDPVGTHGNLDDSMGTRGNPDDPMDALGNPDGAVPLPPSSRTEGDAGASQKSASGPGTGAPSASAPGVDRPGTDRPPAGRAEPGGVLVDGPPAAVPARGEAPPEGGAALSARDLLAGYLHAQAAEFLRSLRLHRESGADAEEAVEAVRQLRGSARRISGALYTFRPLTDTAWADPLRAELAWLSGTLAREHAYAARLARLRAALHRLSGAESPPYGTPVAGTVPPTRVRTGWTDPTEVPDIASAETVPGAGGPAGGGEPAEGEPGAGPSRMAAQRTSATARSRARASAQGRADEAESLPRGNTTADRSPAARWHAAAGRDAAAGWPTGAGRDGGAGRDAAAGRAAADGRNTAAGRDVGAERDAGVGDREIGGARAGGPGAAFAGNPSASTSASAYAPAAQRGAERPPAALTVGAARAGALLERQLTLARTRAHSAALQALGSSRFHAVADAVAVLASEAPLDTAAAQGPADEVLVPLVDEVHRRMVEAVDALPLYRAGHPYNAEALAHGLAATATADAPPATEQQDAPWHQVRMLVRLRRYAQEVLDSASPTRSSTPVAASAPASASAPAAVPAAAQAPALASLPALTLTSGEPSAAGEGFAARLLSAAQALDRHRDAAEAAAAAATAARTPRIAPATAYALGVLHADQRHDVEAARFAFGWLWQRLSVSN
ncbi:CHAD domain-containing protein [Streptomyces pathocidini]|uniref:CHAD domain-containing protein n=2 Tax=Streptomyces pathocidini TaxID=1650571 RepID=A0ABW7UWS1_9ACTN